MMGSAKVRSLVMVLFLSFLSSLFLIHQEVGVGQEIVELLVFLGSMRTSPMLTESRRRGWSLTWRRRPASLGPDQSRPQGPAAPRRRGTARGAKITVPEEDPAGRGLGGGSSNAATTLLGLKGLWALGLGVGIWPPGEGPRGRCPYFLQGGLPGERSATG